MDISVSTFKVDIFKIESIVEYTDEGEYVDTNFVMSLSHKSSNEYDTMKAYSILNSMNKSVGSYSDYVDSLVDYVVGTFDVLKAAVKFTLEDRGRIEDDDGMYA
jgi:hypothetical protein